MRKLDQAVAWLLIAFGLLHISFTGKFDPTFGANAIWFACGGLLMVSVSVLNLLRVSYASVAKGVHAVSVGANIVLLLLMVFIAVRFPILSNPQVAVGLGLAALLTAFSVFRHGDRGQARQVEIGK